MIRRFLSALLLAWLLGFALFAVMLPGPAGDETTDAVVVLTGGKGRIEQGVRALAQKRAKRMFVSGVDPLVTRGALAEALDLPPRLVACCIDLGKDAVDTRSNARETALWLRSRRYASVRLVTNDWHMPRARFELRRAVGAELRVIPDAVESAPGLAVLFNEYNKLLLRRIQALLDTSG